MEKLKVGISTGDINGVGLEVIIKSLDNVKILDLITPIIYGSVKVISYHKNIVNPGEFNYHSIANIDQVHPEKINIVNCWSEDVNISLGEPNEESGKFAYSSLDKAAQDLKYGLIDVLVTAPVDKHAMYLAGFPYTGHTEFLTSLAEQSESLMLMVSDELRIGLVTNHIPISRVADTLSEELIFAKIKIYHETLQKDFGIERPIIAILGLNPHAGDRGLVGDEEERLIRPAILRAKESGMLVGGPFSADGFFGSGDYLKVDGTLAMYHDQGLIPFKALSFGQGVNYTAGLSFVRTSPDHGTAYKIAGKNQADPSSFRKALFLAVDLFRNRQTFEELHMDPLQKEELIEESEGE